MAKVKVLKEFIYKGIMQVKGTELEVSDHLVDRMKARGLVVKVEGVVFKRRSKKKQNTDEE